MSVAPLWSGQPRPVSVSTRGWDVPPPQSDNVPREVIWSKIQPGHKRPSSKRSLPKPISLDSRLANLRSVSQSNQPKIWEYDTRRPAMILWCLRCWRLHEKIGHRNSGRQMGKLIHQTMNGLIVASNTANIFLHILYIPMPMVFSSFLLRLWSHILDCWNHTSGWCFNRKISNFSVSNGLIQVDPLMKFPCLLVHHVTSENYISAILYSYYIHIIFIFWQYYHNIIFYFVRLQAHSSAQFQCYIFGLALKNCGSCAEALWSNLIVPIW